MYFGNPHQHTPFTLQTRLPPTSYGSSSRSLQLERSQRCKSQEHQFYPDYQSPVIFQLFWQNSSRLPANVTQPSCSHHLVSRHTVTCSFFPLLLSAVFLPYCTFVRRGRRRRLFFLLPLTTFRSAASLAASLAGRTFILGIPGIRTRLLWVLVLLTNLKRSPRRRVSSPFSAIPTRDIKITPLMPYLSSARCFISRNCCQSHEVKTSSLR